MLCEIDWCSINVQLARLLGISLMHFNQLESAIFAALKYDVGISEERFKARLTQMEKVCADQHSTDTDEKISGLEKAAVNEESRSDGE